MVPTLHNLPLINDIDDISILNGAETVSDGDCSAPFGDTVKCFLDDFLGGRVKGRGSFVEKSVVSPCQQRGLLL